MCDYAANGENAVCRSGIPVLRPSLYSIITAAPTANSIKLCPDLVFVDSSKK